MKIFFFSLFTVEKFIFNFFFPLDICRTWLEWKMLHQYQLLFESSLLRISDISYRIAINTRVLAETAADRRDIEVLNLCIRYFNTYIRLSINERALRACFNVLHQYRQLGEHLLLSGSEKDGITSAEAHTLVREIVWYLRYYSIEALDHRFEFLAEIIAHDIGSLCAVAYAFNAACHDELLELLLTGLYDNNAIIYSLCEKF